VIHPTQAEVAQTTLSLGGRSYGAALPWSTLSQSVLDRACFFHYASSFSTHGDQPKAMRLRNKLAGGEMIVSAYAKHLAPCLGAVQAEPVAVGAGANATEAVSYSGRALPTVSPTQLRQLLTGSVGGGWGGTQVSPLVGLRSMRDTALDQLYALAKEDATNVQIQFIDALATSQQQVRHLAESLADTLSNIDNDGVEGQALAAAALFSANVTPVVTVRIPFGGDNHSDSDLQAEVDQHVTGVEGIQQMMDAVSGMGLADKVTFSTLNVFGRNLNGISKTESRSGRDHYANHAVNVMIGKNVRGGVVGGVMPISDRLSSGALGAADIDPATGAGTPGASIPWVDTDLAMARTLAVALGIPEADSSTDFIPGAGGVVVPAALV
jgi:hypothetical protein